MIDNIYGELANKVCTNVIKTGKFPNVKTFDPATIIMIINVIINVIIQVVKCYLNKKLTPKQALAMAQKPGIVEKVLLKRFIKNAIKDGNVSKVNRVTLRTELNEEILKMAKDGTEEQILELSAKLDETEKKVKIFMESSPAAIEP